MSAAREEGKSLKDVIKSLCREESYAGVYHRHKHDVPMPSVTALTEMVERLRAVIFPGYFGSSEVRPDNMPYHVGFNLDAVLRILAEQIKRGICFLCALDQPEACVDCERRAHDLAMTFLEGLPRLRAILAKDVEAAYDGDPAAKSHGETIFCYPSIQAVTNYRIAHELHGLGVSIIPRIITEMAHSATGIDIHPGATIGERFFIDHGTGVVIGETCVIGRNVRLYQGVTLGAKSFPRDDQGNPLKGIPRHPIVEDDVIIYSGATILGRVTIGRGAVVGGNVWLTDDVPAGAGVMQGDGSRPAISFKGGL